jgi:hypothetical protein
LEVGLPQSTTGLLRPFRIELRFGEWPKLPISLVIIDFKKRKSGADLKNLCFKLTPSIPVETQWGCIGGLKFADF